MARHAIGLIAGGMIIGASLALMSVPRPCPVQTYALLAVAPDGEAYAIDTGLTADDCLNSHPHVTNALCVKE